MKKAFRWILLLGGIALIIGMVVFMWRWLTWAKTRKEASKEARKSGDAKTTADLPTGLGAYFRATRKADPADNSAVNALVAKVLTKSQAVELLKQWAFSQEYAKKSGSPVGLSPMEWGELYGFENLPDNYSKG